MSDPQATEWREFEKFIARVEGLLSSVGAVVKSPDYVPDVATGQLRQVDASIRQLVGTVPILITIECRKRRGSEDQTWIEQLATKKESIGAAKTIAVSSSGLSAPAVDLARRKGIEARVMGELPDEIIRHWITELQFGVYQTQWKLLHLDCVFYEPNYTEEQVKDASRCLTGPNAAGKSVFMSASRGLCTANDLVDELVSVKGVDETGFDIPRDGQPHKRLGVATYSQGSLALIHGDRQLPITKMSFEFDLILVCVGSSGQGRFGEYRSDASSVCYAAEYSTSIDGLDGVECTLSFQKDIRTQQTTCGFSILDENTGRIWTTGQSHYPPKQPRSAVSNSNV